MGIVCEEAIKGIHHNTFFMVHRWTKAIKEVWNDFYFMNFWSILTVLLKLKEKANHCAFPYCGLCELFTE